MDLRLSQCTLRPFRRGDEEALVANANDREVWRNLRDRFPHPYTAADAEWWVAHASASPDPTNIAIEVDGVAAGSIGFTPGVDIYRRSAEIGYWLGRAHWGRGIATEAVMALTAHILASTEIVRLHASVFAHNGASARVLEKAGYQLEGRQHHAVFKDGELVDQLLYAFTVPPA